MGKQVLRDYFLVAVDQMYEKMTTKAGIQVLNDAWIEEKERYRFQHKRIYGVVTSVPRGYSLTNVAPIDMGEPNPQLYVGHDIISEMRARGYDWDRDHYYHPGMAEKYAMVTLQDYGAKSTVKVGDKVYFNPIVTEEENFIEGQHRSGVFKIRVDHIFCTVVDGVIHPQGGYVLVEANMESWEDITTPMGIIKKPAPEAKVCEGWIRHVTAGSELTPGELIYYIKDADWGVKIEGKEYFVMMEKEILCGIDEQAAS
jgi:co-chaperonin GroES (HSP10)